MRQRASEPGAGQVAAGVGALARASVEQFPGVSEKPGATGWPGDDWPTQSGGIYERYANFYGWKNGVTWTPPAPWKVSPVSAESYDLQGVLTNEGPLPGEGLLNTIRFKRDYIGPELRELEQRQLEPPQYEIRMLSGDEN